MRAEFRIWHDGDDLYHIIFDQQTKSRIRVESFPAASELINQLMTAMIAGVRNNPVLRVDKLAEGIRKFAVDQEKLEKMIGDLL